MATSVGHDAPSLRSQKKNAKKQSKKRHTVLKRNRIYPVEHITHHVVVANGGLDNNITFAELEKIFQQHGEVVDIIMQPQKSYAFVSMSCTADMERAYSAINGRPMKSPDEVATAGVTFYLDYVDSGNSVPSNRLPGGLILCEDFVDEKEEELLLQCVDWDSEDKFISEGGILKHRRVKHFGYEFLYSTNNVDRQCPLENDVPEACQPVLKRVYATGHVPFKIDQLTVNQYESGQGIPPHVDTHSAFEDGIMSLSLGSQCVMEFKHPNGEHLSVLLPRRSLLVMTKESRYVWTHGITPRKSDIVSIQKGSNPEDGQRLTLLKRDTRTSFTFRKIRTTPCACAFAEQCDSQQGTSSAPNKNKQKSIQLPQSEREAIQMEKAHVHEVYEEIAGHFSDTRHSPWPRVSEFLQKQPDGAIVLDVGCGNGKYLGVNKACFCVGCDRSINLCLICAERGHPAFVADVLHLPLRSGLADVAISIAVIHHFSTPERRRNAVEEMLRVMKVGGQGLIYVWALEQEKEKVKSNYLKDTRIKRKDCLKSEEEELLEQKGITTKSSPDSIEVSPSSSLATKVSILGIDETQTPDEPSSMPSENQKLPEMTPDVMSVQGSSSTQASNPHTSPKSDVPQDNIDIKSTERTLSVHVNRTHFENQDLLVPWHNKPKQNPGGKAVGKSGDGDDVVHRFYHVFRQGELEALCRSFNELEILHTYYDKGNWCVIFQKQ